MTTAPPRPIAAGELTAREVDALVFQTVVLLGSLPDLAVALVRVARRDRGVQLGPVLATLVVASLTPPLGRRALRAPGRSGVAARSALLLATPAAPVLAGALRTTVVGTRAPAWQLLVSASVRVVSGILTVLPVAWAVARRRRAAAVTAG